MSNKEKIKQTTDSHILAVDICLEGEAEPTYRALGNGRVEVAELIELPYQITTENNHNSRFLALQFVWWFELFHETLLEHSVYQEDFQFRFYSEYFLVYNVVINSPSIEDAEEQIKNIHLSVSNKLAAKMKDVDHKYETFMLGEKRPK